MEQFKRAKMVLLPTEKKTGIFCDNNDKLYFSLVNKIRDYAQGKHLYIISDDEIKEGDWCIYLGLSMTYFKVIDIDGDRLYYNSREYFNKNICKKIIATTDTSLGLPQPSQQFIEKYIEEYNKGNIITDVLVEYEEYTCPRCKGERTEIVAILGERPCLKCKGDGILSKNIKLKINPKDNTITIKKIKDSYSKIEVIELFKKHNIDICKKYHISYIQEFTDKWIEENL